MRTPRFHLCYASGCGEQVHIGLLMCKKHWLKVPKDLRDKVWESRDRCKDSSLTEVQKIEAEIHHRMACEAAAVAIRE